MIQEDEPIQTLVSLGLTNLQAKVYLTLLKLGNTGADVRKISRASRIVRQDVYRILPTLQKIGLVDKIIATPTIYRPLPFEQGLSMLMKKKAEEFSEVQKKANYVLNNFNFGQDLETLEDASQFIITSERKIFLKRVKKDIAETQTTIDIIYSHERIRAIMFHTIDEFQQAIARGIKIRALTDKGDAKMPDKNIGALTKTASFHLKYLARGIPVGLIIFDNRDVNIRTAEKLVPSLWTNNRNVVRLAKIYFDCMWK